jgi:serine O-acetyltransferase
MTVIDSFPDKLFEINSGYCAGIPSLTKTQHFVSELIFFLFPIKYNCSRDLEEVRSKWIELQDHFNGLLEPFAKDLPISVEEANDSFFSAIPEIHTNLLDDACNFAKCDPAANTPEEVILSYPGFYAISVYRLAHVLYELKIPLLPRMVSEYAHSKTGIDIHPGATIGKSFYIDHGTGIVIGETSIIGNSVKIYQGVTIGALSVEKNLANKKRHPTIEDNVIVYSGSTILGGNTVIGHDTIIGGNVWLTESVPPHSVVYHKAQTVIRDGFPFPEPLNFVI